MKKKFIVLALAMVLLFGYGLLVYTDYDCDYDVPAGTSPNSDDPGGTEPPRRPPGSR